MIIRKFNSLNVDYKVILPPSKSCFNRALILASYRTQPTILKNVFAIAEDVEEMIATLEKLHVQIENNNECLEIKGNGNNFNISPTNAVLNCGLSGTVTRFIIGLSLLFRFEITITASGRMLARPVADLINAIEELGNIQVTANVRNNNRSLPITVPKDKCFDKKDIILDGHKSSQFVTAIMLVAPAIGLEKITVVNPVSESYINLTIDIMKEFGTLVVSDSNIQKENDTNQRTYIMQNITTDKQTPVCYSIEPDYSCASYLLALEYLFDVKLNIAGLSFKSLQSDAKFIDILKTIKAHRLENQQKLIIDMSEMPDTSMTAMIVCAFENFVTKITGLRTLIDKECNRLEAMQNELQKINIATVISEDNNSIEIFGNSSLRVNELTSIETYKDHRMAMCFGILGAKTGNILITNPQVVNKSFKTFWEILDNLYV